MSEGTDIGWTKRPGTREATLNPIRARLKKDPRKVGWYCEKFTEGCTGCYAHFINMRLGTGLPYKPGHLDEVDIYLDEEVLLRPLSWKKPHTIFWVSMSDAFARFVPKEWNDKMLAVMAMTPHHHHIVLTKREEGANGYFTDPEMVFRVHKAAAAICQAHEFPGQEGFLRDGGFTGFASWPLRNLFVGFSAERQADFDRRWAAFKDIATRGWRILVSLEPLLERVILPDDFLALGANAWAIPGGASRQRGYNPPHFSFVWARSVIQQCRPAGVAVFVKQGGSAWATGYNRMHGPDAVQSDGKGTVTACWPEDCRVQEFPL